MYKKTEELSFLDASKINKTHASDNPDKIYFASSANIDPLTHFLKANYSLITKQSLQVEMSVEFGSLKQGLITGLNTNDAILLLFPWDILEILNWRQGISKIPENYVELVNENIELINKNGFKKIIYFSFPIPPSILSKEHRHKVNIELLKFAASINADILYEGFSLQNYLLTGCPFKNSYLDLAAKEIISRLLNIHHEPKKLIVTDLDNTLWNGILGEDGINGIKSDNQATGFIHFLYQTYLKELSRRGILLAICSKNDEDLVLKALESEKNLMKVDDFVFISASYERKSKQIRQIAKGLNLGLESFIFIDDNPIEINEVKIEIPEVSCFQFINNSDEMINVFLAIEELCKTENVTSEDLSRTKIYKNMNQNSSLKKSEFKNIFEYLKSLDMELKINDRSFKNNERAIQLINKTNQFNMNGIRKDSEEIEQIISDGGKLLTGDLIDCNGSHGEVIAALITKDLKLESFVMSCRVFQRELEYIFLKEILERFYSNLTVSYEETERNSPFKLFLDSLNLPTVIKLKTIQSYKPEINSLFKVKCNL